MKEVKKVKEKKRLSRSALVLIIGLVIILIPCLVFAGILLSAALETGRPINGQRFSNDLPNKITDSDISSLESEISSISGVEKAEIGSVETGQLKIMVDVADSTSDEQCQEICNSVYNKVIAKLPAAQYFKATDSYKNYDLAIHVYNQIAQEKADYDKYSYYVLTFNSQMDTPSIQNQYRAKNEQIAKELRGEIEAGDAVEPAEGDADTEPLEQ